jgi:hypothetical protein
MRLRILIPTALLSLVLVAGIRAERPPQQKKAAANVVVGTVEKLDKRNAAFLGDGVRTDYTATVKVDKVERGAQIKEGDTIKITWYHVTKRPSKPVPGAYGHGYPVVDKSKIRVWLLEGKNKTFGVIYNSGGIEALKTEK